MGFLKNFSEPFAFAMALWPFVSMLLTVPVLALLYHRDNRILLSSAIVAYGTVLYLLGLLCFTLYPMPADAAAYCAAHHLTPQLNPLQFIGDIRTDGLTAVLQIADSICWCSSASASSGWSSIRCRTTSYKTGAPPFGVTGQPPTIVRESECCAAGRPTIWPIPLRNRPRPRPSPP